MNPRDYGADGRGEEIPHYVGTVVTRRWFAVDRKGVLHSPFRDSTPWSPKYARTQYVAHCKALPWGEFTFGMFAGLDFEDYNAHQVAMKDCSCGFYSYFKKPRLWDLDFQRHQNMHYVGAIVENFGRITYGDKGLRSQKLRILALVYDDRRVSRGPIEWVKFYWSYRCIMLIAMLMLWSVYAGAFVGGLVIAQGDPVWILRLALAGVVVGIFHSYAFFLTTVGTHPPLVGSDTTRGKAMRIKYGLPTYTSWEEAEKDFPTTKRKELA